jgi:hypothetical protein
MVTCVSRQERDGASETVADRGPLDHILRAVGSEYIPDHLDRNKLWADLELAFMWRAQRKQNFAPFDGGRREIAPGVENGPQTSRLYR